jgi:hypothetical protein
MMISGSSRMYTFRLHGRYLWVMEKHVAIETCLSTTPALYVFEDAILKNMT